MKMKFKIVLFFGIIFISFISFVLVKESFATENISNYNGDYVLNPEWVTYMAKSSEERDEYNVIPEMFLVNKISSSERKLFSFRSITYPEYFNLNDLGYVTKPRNQYSLGLCWAFAGISSLESNLLINGVSNIVNPIIFSERQLDYASVNKKYIKEGYNPYAIALRDMPGDGGYTKSAFQLFSFGISPVSVNKFGYFNENKDVKPMKDIFNLDNVEYSVDSYVNLGGVFGYSTNAYRSNWIKNIKNHVMNYGSVSIGSIGPLVGYAGSCVYKDASGNNMLNVNGECNPININNKHAMAIIGWDDNYSYKYCRHSDETSSNLTNCENIIEGKGAFILKNSWGDTYPYPYLAYSSDVDSAYGVVQVSVKDWDVNYDYTKVKEVKYDAKVSKITFNRSKKIAESIVKIGIYVNSVESLDYQIYVDANNIGEYKLVDEVNLQQIGMFSIDVDNIKLLGDNFSIKVVSSKGYVDQIHAFTKYDDKIEDLIIDTVIQTGVDYKSKIEKFSLYSVTRNISSGEKINYRFITQNGEDITNKVSVTDNVVLNNIVNPKIVFNDILPIGKIRIETLYNNQVYDIEEINVNELISLWSSGTGTKEDPFIIKTANDFLNIYTDSDYLERHYKLGNNLDLSSVNNWNIGEISNYASFKGSFDGSGYEITGLTCKSNLCAIFYLLDEALIKNIIFTNITYEVAEYGWGNLLGILAYNSTFENIIITKSVNISGKGTYMGGIVASVYGTNIKNVANYANIKSTYNYQNGLVSGIVNEGFGSTIMECYNYGNIESEKSLAAGIVSYLGVYGSEGTIGQVVDSYNVGKVFTNNLGGGIVGEGNLSLVSNTYSFINDKSSQVGELVGNAFGMVIKNSYYLSDRSLVIFNNDNSTVNNVMAINNDNLNKKDSYLGYDFDKIWAIGDKYPYLKDFNYKFIQEIIIDEEIILNNGESVMLDIKFIPEDATNKKIKYEIDNMEIITINDNFELLTKKSGETKVKIKALDGNLVEKEVIIKVIDKIIDLDKYEVINDNNIKVPLNVNKQDFIDEILVNKQYTIVVDSVNEIDKLATGDKIKIYYNDKLVEEYLIFIIGDVVGDGNINVNSVAKLYQYVRNKVEIKNEFLLAANIISDDKIAVSDVAKLYQYVKRKIDSLD